MTIRQLVKKWLIQNALSPTLTSQTCSVFMPACRSQMGLGDSSGSLGCAFRLSKIKKYYNNYETRNEFTSTWRSMMYLTRM